MSEEQMDEASRAEEREEMVQRTIVARGIRDPAVLSAMRSVPRHRFVPESVRALAYRDEPLPIGSGQTISQPFVVAWMAELGAVAQGKRVLEIGTGSGYQAAVLAAIGATVYSIERDATLYDRARALLDALGYRVSLLCGDGKLGWPEEAPFDAILIAAAASRVPDALIEQLAPEGKLVAPVGTADLQEMIVLSRTSYGALRRSSHGAVAFVPLL